jgi:hypothetical protein
MESKVRFKDKFPPYFKEQSRIPMRPTAPVDFTFVSHHHLIDDNRKSLTALMSTFPWQPGPAPANLTAVYNSLDLTVERANQMLVEVLLLALPRPDR